MAAFAPELKNYLDTEGRLRQWPTKQKLQLLALPTLAAAIPSGRRLTEREVNELLNERATFGDPALLRRMLCDLGYLDRTSDGRAYWRTSLSTEPSG
jgi:hypothetical protein